MARGAGALCISSRTVLGSAKCCLLARGKEQEGNSEDRGMIARPEAFLFSRCSLVLTFSVTVIPCPYGVFVWIKAVCISAENVQNMERARTV